MTSSQKSTDTHRTTPKGRTVARREEAPFTRDRDKNTYTPQKNIYNKINSLSTITYIHIRTYIHIKKNIYIYIYIHIYIHIYIFQGVYITLSTVALVENEVASGENWNAKKKTKEPAQNKTIRTRRDCEKRP